jgi:hypothetical protein
MSKFGEQFYENVSQGECGSPFLLAVLRKDSLLS